MFSARNSDVFSLPHACEMMNITLKLFYMQLHIHDCSVLQHVTFSFVNYILLNLLKIKIYLFM